MKFKYIFSSILLFFLTACTVNNLENEINHLKTDFSDNSYILATEDASNSDITRFFTFYFKDVDSEKKYDLINQDDIFTNSDPSTSSGHHYFGRYFFAMAKDKKGMSSTPGVFRLTLNANNRVFIDSELNINKDNLFPSRKITIVDKNTGYFYNEGVGNQKIKIFNPTTMVVKGEIDLVEAIKEFRPEAKFTDKMGNNLIRTGSLVIDSKEGKLYVSVVFLEKASFNLIEEDETSFYLAVIDINTNQFEKFISYNGAKTVGFFVSENNPTTKDENNNLYFCSWGWNQFYEHNPSKIFRIKSGETDFDKNWVIDIESLFGKGRIAQSIISYNNKIYLHISDVEYGFETSTPVSMSYYEFDAENPENYRKLDIPKSNPSSRINIFSVLDDKLFICVPNTTGFNGVYSLDKSDKLTKEITIEGKYRPTRMYQLVN